MNYTARSLRLRIPRLCVSVTGTEASDLFDQAEVILRENTLLELRLDYLKSPLAAMARLRRLSEARPDAILIATCRRKPNGGLFAGSVDEQIEVLRKAVEAGAVAIDVEIETAEALGAGVWEDLRAQAAVVLSYHDFKATAHLEETFERMCVLPADFYKLVSTANCLHDNVVMTRFLEHHTAEYSMVGMCMGEQGTLSRVLGIRAGAAFTFGAIEQGKETAPGQPTFRELRDFYRIEQVEPVTKIFGIAGDPVSHSMSPWVMNAAFRRENVNAVYLPLHAKTIEDLLATLTGLPLDGMSVTMPFKQAIAEHLDNSDVLTQRTGACNTVVRGKDGRLFGFNTDVYGIVAAIESRVLLAGSKILVLGAGGAARAAVFGLHAKGANVAVWNRTPEKAQALAKQAGVTTIQRSELASRKFDVIFNATPIGMGADTNTPLSAAELNATWVFDSVYNPIETPLIKLAQSKGLGTISGTEMFVHQAARQFEIWTGKPAPLDLIRQVLLRQLGATSVDNVPLVATVVSPKKAAMVDATASKSAASESGEVGSTSTKASHDKAAAKTPAKKAAEGKKAAASPKAVPAKAAKKSAHPATKAKPEVASAAQSKPTHAKATEKSPTSAKNSKPTKVASKHAATKGKAAPAHKAAPKVAKKAAASKKK